MKMRVFAGRNLKEILRDPLNLAFGLGFPLAILLLLSAIQKNISVDLFSIERLAPGIAVFGLTFISLFSGTLIAKDRGTSFLLRLFASPLSARDYIVGYIVPMLPVATAQSVICFAAAAILGLKLNAGLLVCLLTLIPTAMLFIGIGLLCGTVFTDKQVGGICGALLTNLCGWLSGIWFDLDLIGGGFRKVAGLLPFMHAVNAAKAAAAGTYSAIFPDLWWVIGYAAVILAAAIAVFHRKMSADAR